MDVEEGDDMEEDGDDEVCPSLGAQVRRKRRATVTRTRRRTMRHGRLGGLPQSAWTRLFRRTPSFCPRLVTRYGPAIDLRPWQIVVTLVGRFKKEREENVKLEVFSTFSGAVRHMSALAAKNPEGYVHLRSSN